MRWLKQFPLTACFLLSVLALMIVQARQGSGSPLVIEVLMFPAYMLSTYATFFTGLRWPGNALVAALLMMGTDHALRRLAVRMRRRLD